LRLLEPGDLVVDIGSNDGTLLSNFQADGQRVFGIEPTRAGQLARDRGIETLEAFFGLESAGRARTAAGPAKMITAANVFAHIEDIHEVVRSLLGLLGEDGVFVSESHYFLSLVETLQYDTIYHEHLRYYTLHSLQHLLALHGLEIFHAKRIPTHGGSFRAYAARAGRRPVLQTVGGMLEQERTAGLDAPGLAAFRRRVVASKLGLHALLCGIRAAGHRIFGVGAPSRASTLISYVGLDDGIVDCVVEVPGSRKIGKYMPGTLIPVVEESHLFAEQPEYALLLSWHIADELIPKLLQKGFRGRFIVPLPEPRILEGGSRP
ncbi:MAG: class I SAM-dependent methyltransferase, partial [bacterium]